MGIELTVVNVVKMMLKRWWIILLACIVGGTAFFSYNKYVVDAVYTAQGSLFVNNVRDKKSENVNIGDMTTSQMLVWTYIELLSSNTFMNKVADSCELGYSGEQIAKMVSLSSQNETEIMKITATATDPEYAQKIVNTVLEEAPSEIDRIIKGGSVEVVDYALCPKNPSGPNVTVWMLVGFVFGGAISGGIVLLKEILNNKVKDEDELTKLYQIPVLGTIPHID